MDMKTVIRIWEEVNVGVPTGYPKNNVLVKFAERIEALKQPLSIDDMVSRFLVWPLPPGVCPDACTIMRDYPHPVTGTNLLNATEARQMIQHLLGADNKTERIKSVADGVEHRYTLRGFYVPEDAADLLAAIRGA